MKITYVCTLGLALVSINSEQCKADNIHWTNLHGGSWQVATNWSPNRVPGTADNAIIRDDLNGFASYAVTIDGLVEVGSLTLGGYGLGYQTLSNTSWGLFLEGPSTVAYNGHLVLAGGGIFGPGDLTVEAGLDYNLIWTGGTITGTGATTLKGHILFQGASPSALLLDGRVLTVEGTVSLVSTLSLRNGAKIINDVNGLVEVIDPASVVSLGGTTEPEFDNYGHFRVGPGTAEFDCLGVINYGRVDLDTSRTVLFTNQFVQGDGRLRLGGASLANLDPLAIHGGELGGFGQISNAQVNAVLAPSAAGLRLGSLILLPAAQSQFKLTGTNAGTGYDHLLVSDSVELDGSLEVHFGGGFENYVQSSASFEIISIQPGTTSLIGSFTNVPFGQRLPTSDGFGSFLVSQIPPGIGSVVLSDYSPLPIALTVPSVVGYPFPPEICLLDPSLTLLARPDGNWAGGTFALKALTGFDPANDHLDIQNVGSGPGQIGVGGGEAFYGGTSIATVSGLGSGEIQGSFNTNATTSAIQALLQALMLTKSGFAADNFKTWDVRFADETFQLSLGDGIGHQVLRTNRVEFPYLVGLHCQPLFEALDVEVTGTLQLVGEFVDGHEEPVPIDVAVNGACEQFPAASIQFVSPGVYSYQTYQWGGQCVFTFTAGPLTARAPFFVAGSTGYGPSCLGTFAGFVAVYGCGCTECPCPENRPGPPWPVALDLNTKEPPGLSLANFRALEGLMNQTSEGRRLANLYWQYSDQLVKTLKTNIPLALQVAQVALDFQPAVSALLSGNAAAAWIAKTNIDELNAVWNALESNASPQLKSAMETERSRFHNFQDFIGKDFSQWAGMLQIPSPTQAWIYLSSPKLRTNQFTLEANFVTNSPMYLWRTTDLTNWVPATGVQMQTNGFTLQLQDTNPIGSPKAYQIRDRAQ
jgi:hypothetical protein